MPFGMSVTMKADKFLLNTLFIHWGMLIKAYSAKTSQSIQCFVKIITTWTSDNDKQLGSCTFIRTVKVQYFGLFIHILNRCEQTHQLNALGWLSLRKQLIFCNATTGWPFTISPFTWSTQSNHGLGKCYTKFIWGKFPRRIALTIWPNQFHSPKNGCGGVNLVSKMTWRNGTQSSVHNIPFRKTRQTFQMFHCSRKRSAETTQKIVFHLLSTWVFQKRLVNGKKPMSEECLQKFHTGEVSPPRSV